MNRFKKAFTVFILIIFVFITSACTNSLSDNSKNNKSSAIENKVTKKNNFEKEIENIFTLIDSREYAKLYSSFTKEFTDQVSQEQFVSLFQQSFNNLGKLNGIESIIPDKINEKEMYHVKVNFEMEDKLYLISFDKDGLILGLTKDTTIQEENPPKLSEEEVESKIKGIFTIINTREYHKLYSSFNKQALGDVSKEQFIAASEQSFNNFGKLIGIESILPETVKGQEVYHVKVNFEKLDFPFLITFDKDGLITNLVKDTTIQEDNSSDIENESNALIEELPITIGTSPWELPGKLTLPKDARITKFPALILVHGSGPNDMDETIGPNKVFKDIAHGLSEQGVAVLRYTKRNRAYPMPKSYTAQELVMDDVLEAYKFLSSHPSIDKNRIFVAGHSLGGWLIPQIARQLPEGAGFITLAGPSRPFTETLKEQVEYISSLDINKSEQAQSTIKLLKERINNVETGNLSDNCFENLLGHPKDFWLALNGYIAAEEYKSIPQPLLVLQGEMDYQVNMKDFEAWKTTLSYRDDVTFKSYRKLTHLFMESFSNTELSTSLDYGFPSHVSSEVMKDITEWINSQN